MPHQRLPTRELEWSASSGGVENAIFVRATSSPISSEVEFPALPEEDSSNEAKKHGGIQLDGRGAQLSALMEGYVHIYCVSVSLFIMQCVTEIVTLLLIGSIWSEAIFKLKFSTSVHAYGKLRTVP